MVVGSKPVNSSGCADMLRKLSTGPVIAVGECMIELAPADGSWRLGYAGDTFNTAVYLARLDETVEFLTALGDDEFSAEMRAYFRAEGLGTALVLTAPARLPGLYAIRTNDDGERSFHYWRSQAAVRALFSLEGCERALHQVAEAGLLYVSGISLSLFDEGGRGRLIDIARAVRARGGDVAFDPNYRAALWHDPSEARDTFSSFGAVSSVVLPTFDDEASLYGDATPQETIERWCSAGVEEVVVKQGARGCTLLDGRVIAPQGEISVIDTTGAGDAFNAGYLAARIRGYEPAAAARCGNRLAGAVVGHRGAILPRDQMPQLDVTALPGETMPYG